MMHLIVSRHDPAGPESGRNLAPISSKHTSSTLASVRCVLQPVTRRQLAHPFVPELSVRSSMPLYKTHCAISLAYSKFSSHVSIYTFSAQTFLHESLSIRINMPTQSTHTQPCNQPHTISHIPITRAPGHRFALHSQTLRLKEYPYPSQRLPLYLSPIAHAPDHRFAGNPQALRSKEYSYPSHRLSTYLSHPPVMQAPMVNPPTHNGTHKSRHGCSTPLEQLWQPQARAHTPLEALLAPHQH